MERTLSPPVEMQEQGAILRDGTVPVTRAAKSLVSVGGYRLL